MKIICELSENACGGKLLLDYDYNHQAVAIASPNYPAPFGADLECEWNIYGVPGHRVVVFIDGSTKIDLIGILNCAAAAETPDMKTVNASGGVEMMADFYATHRTCLSVHDGQALLGEWCDTANRDNVRPFTALSYTS